MSLGAERVIAVEVNEPPLGDETGQADPSVSRPWSDARLREELRLASCNTSEIKFILCNRHKRVRITAKREDGRTVVFKYYRLTNSIGDVAEAEETVPLGATPWTDEELALAMDKYKMPPSARMMCGFVREGERSIMNVGGVNYVYDRNQNTLLPR
jgi:hypothetical protein